MEASRARQDEDDEESEDENAGNGLPTRTQFIETGMRLGGKPEELGATYDAWAATEDGQRVLAGGDDGDGSDA